MSNKPEVLAVATPSAETQTTWRYCGITAFGLQGHRKPQLAKSAHAPGMADFEQRNSRSCFFQIPFAAGAALIAVHLPEKIIETIMMNP